ncbi:hypothetical protein MJO28_004543 [Puccinia striiformis f. sp. tritici]|uniref:Uncharacterized protein n=1 Tax=Puccinia striiformis f. sp. tritici TaxID=168172 RepID=A0ACC0EQY9_9BASI|nr:hypothetical protein MJO28_004543 [Puccinia striiformis f. sp. tritici]
MKIQGVNMKKLRLYLTVCEAEGSMGNPGDVNSTNCMVKNYYPAFYESRFDKQQPGFFRHHLKPNT